MSEKELLKKSGLVSFFILFLMSLFWFLFSIQPCSAGYTGGPVSGIDIGINSRATTQANWQVGSSGVFVLRLGIENVTGSGSSGYMTGTNTYYPRIEWTPTLGTFNFVGTGSYPVTVQMNGVAIPSAGSVTGKIDAVGGTGTTNVFTDATLAGLGTITASFGANGLVITPVEYSSVNNATSELQAQITTATGSITNHTHTGGDGTTQVSHTNLTNKGTQTHTQIDNFVAKEGQANGLATTDANSLVVQNPASGTSTPGASKTVMSDGTGKILDGWLSDNVTKMGTPTTDNISEGSTNKYYTDARVNAAVGSLSVNTLSDVNIIFNENDFVKIVGGQLVAGSSTVTVAFSEVTGSATASQLPLISGLNGSATFAQLPTVLRLSGTTTNQAAGDYGQLYVKTTTIHPSDTFRFFRITNSTGYRADGFNECNEIAFQTAAGTETATEYTISTDNTDEDGSGLATNAFDGNIATVWSSNGALPHWIIADYGTGSSQTFTGVNIYTYPGGGGHNYQGFTVAGSQDKVLWKNIYTGTCTSTQGVWQQFTFNLANYLEYSMKYLDPVNGNMVLGILTPGTVTTEASYIYCNATTTVWGLGTNTAVTGTLSGAYAGWTNRPIRVSAVDIGSSKEIKDNIKTIKIKPDLLDAEGLAKANYIAGAKSAWMVANQASYTIIVNETGTGSVTVIDTTTMETDYNSYIELEWASDINQDSYIENIQKTYEKEFWQMYNSVTPRSWNPKNNPDAEYEGFVVEEMPPVVWGEDGQSLNMMSIVAYMSVVQQTLKADTIFALSTLKELLTTGTVTQQKIDYVNDRLEVLNP